MKCKIASVLYALIVAPPQAPAPQATIEPPPGLSVHQIVATPPREALAQVKPDARIGG